jgi:hypothetical protein
MGTKRTALIVLLARLVGFALGATVLGFAALFVGVSMLPGGMHSGWFGLALFGGLAGVILGGTAGAIRAVRLANSWFGQKE